MRILPVLALLGMTAACVAPPPPQAPAPQAVAAPPPVALVPPPPAPPPVPPPAAVPAVVAVAATPHEGPLASASAADPLALLFAGVPRASAPGRLTLSNFAYDDAQVHAVVTPFGDCEERPGTLVSDFELPLNGTRIIAAAPGSDICWRRALPPGPLPTAPPGVELVSGWTEWSRAFTASGRAIDSHL